MKLRLLRPALAGLIGLAVLPLAGPAARAAEIVYVINSGEASIDLLDAQTHQPIRRIPMLREPHHLVRTPDGKEIVIGDTAGNELLFLDAGTGDFRRRVEITDPYQLGYSPDGKYLVIAAIKRDQIDIYDAASLQLLNRVQGVSMPSHLDFSPDSRTVYVSLQGSRGLAQVDLATGQRGWTANVGPQPAGVMWWHDRLFVGVMGADYIAVVNPQTGQVERQIQATKGAHTTWISPDQRLMYINSRVASSITVVDANTLDRITQWRIAGGPDDMSFAADGKLWVTLRWAQKVAVIDPSNGAYETIAVGRSPHGVMVQQMSPANPTAASDAIQQAQRN